MDSQTVKEIFQTEIHSIINSKICKAYGWEFDVHLDNFLAYVKMSPRSKKETKYLLRISFDDYPQQAPSYVFVDLETKAEEEKAWPPKIKHSEPPSGICIPGTREFYKNIHKTGYDWDYSKQTLFRTLQNIQILIDRPK